MCACILDIVFEVASHILKNKRKWQQIARLDATYVVVLGGMVVASTGIGHRMFNEFLDVIAFFTYLKLF